MQGELGGFPQPIPKRALPPRGSLGASAVLFSLNFTWAHRRSVLCLCSFVLEGRTSSSDFYSVNTLFKDILFYWRLCAPLAACTRCLLYTFEQHFFRLKAKQNLIVPMVSFFTLLPWPQTGSHGVAHGELLVCACKSIPRVWQGAVSGEQELSLPVGDRPGASRSQVRLPSSYAEGAGHLLPGWLAGLLLQPPIGRLAEHHNHFPVMLRPRSRCASHELRVPCGCAAAEAEAGTEVPAGLRRGIGGSMNGSGGGSDLSLAPGPGSGAAQGPHWCMGAAPGP